MKSLSILICLCFLLLLEGKSQCTSLAFESACNSQLDPSCPYWTDACGGGWVRSHGTPNLVPYTNNGTPGFYANMVGDYHPGSTNHTGEGMFIPYSFVANQALTITIRKSNFGAAGSLYLYAATGLTKGPFVGCQDPTPTAGIQEQLIQVISASNSALQDFTIPFTPNANYTQFWMYAVATEATLTHEYNVDVSNVQICPNCARTIIINSGQVPSGQTTGGIISIGSKAGTGGSGIVAIISQSQTQFVASSEVDLLPEFSAVVSRPIGDPTGGSFQAYILNCAYVPPIKGSGIDYDSVNIVIDTIQSVNTNKNSVSSNSTAENSDLDVNSFTSLVVYPTITTGMINVRGPKAEMQNSELKVMDQNGRILSTRKNGSQNQITLNVGNLSNGLYYLQIANKDSNKVLKFIVEK